MILSECIAFINNNIKKVKKGYNINTDVFISFQNISLCRGVFYFKNNNNPHLYGYCEFSNKISELP